MHPGTASKNTNPLRVIVLSTTPDFILLLFSGILRFGCNPEHRRIENPEQFGQAVQEGLWDVVAGLWPDFHFATDAIRAAASQSDANLHILTYKNYGGLALVVVIRKSHPALTEQSERLASALDRLLMDFRDQAASADAELHPEKPAGVRFAPAHDTRTPGKEAIAHDLNNLLTVILSCGEILANRLRGDQSTFPYLQDLLSAASRAETIATQLLASDASQGRNAMDVAGMIAWNRGLLDTMAGNHLAMAIRMTAEPTPVSLDSHRLEEILTDVVVHARLAMPAGGAVEISVRRLEVLPLARVGLRPGSYASVSFDYLRSDDEVLGLAEPPVPATREIASETGLTRVLLSVEKASGGLVIAHDKSRVVTVTIYLPLADPRPERNPR